MGIECNRKLDFKELRLAAGSTKARPGATGERLMFPNCSLGFAPVETLWRVGITPTHLSRERRLGAKNLAARMAADDLKLRWDPDRKVEDASELGGAFQYRRPYGNGTHGERARRPLTL